MVMYWSGSDFEYEGILPTELIPFKSNNLTWSESIDLALKFLYSDTSSRLVMIYLNEPDKEAHAFGSESPEVREWIKNIDNLIGYLNKKVNSINTNIVIVSDHGMDTVTFERVIDLNKYLDNSTYDTAGTSPCLQVGYSLFVFYLDFLKICFNYLQFSRYFQKMENIMKY